MNGSNARAAASAVEDEERLVEEVAADLELPVVYAASPMDEELLAQPLTGTEHAASGMHGAAERSHGTASAGSRKPKSSHPDGGFLPDAVAHFLFALRRAVSEGKVFEIQSLYEGSFYRLSEKFYAKTAWPKVELVRQTIGEEDVVFEMLYRELYYRHIYTRLHPSWEDRIGSFENYRTLFEFIVDLLVDDDDVVLELPNQWLWDMVDEFVYQFETFSRFLGGKLLKKESGSATAEDLQVLESWSQNKDIWSVSQVLQLLHGLVDKANVRKQLQAASKGEDVQAAAGVFGRRPFYRNLGFFSLIGLTRVHCLLGDFHLALRNLDNLELYKKGLFARVTAAHVTLFYYVSLAYMMMRRYSDAIKSLSHVLLFLTRTKQYHSRSNQFDQLVKKSNQMYALLAICVSLCPQRVDDQVHTPLREKYNDQIVRIQRGGEDVVATLEELFGFATPRFLAPSPVATGEYQKHILRVFLQDAQQQLVVPVLRSYLKLYTTLDVEKLSSLLQDSSAATATTTAVAKDTTLPKLLCYKNKNRPLRWSALDTPTSLLSGHYETSSDLDFFLRDKMVHVSEVKTGRRFGDYFIRNIQKFEEVASAMVGGMTVEVGKY